MTSITTFAYGLTVRATGLITAAHAWPSLEPTFEFFDLIFLRKRKGTLQSRMTDSTEQGIIANLPVEVWEEIGKWLVVIEMEDAEDAMLRQFVEPFSDDEDTRSFDTQRLTWINLDTSNSSSFRWWRNDEAFIDFSDGFISGLGESIEPIHRLLAHHGLAHPLTQMITYSNLQIDLQAVAFISISCGTSTGEHSVISAVSNFSTGPDEQTLVNVSLELPPDANTRFVRFIRTFSLEVVQVSHSTLRTIRPSWKAKEGPERDRNSFIPRDGEHGLDEEKVKVTKEIVPGWKLYTTCWTDY